MKMEKIDVGISRSYIYMEKTTDPIRKRRIRWYGHLTRMNKDRFTNRIHTYKIRKPKRLTGVERDWHEVDIVHEDIQQRESHKKTIHAIQSFRGKCELKTGNQTEERKYVDRRMQDYWAEVKTKQLKYRGP